MPSKIAFSGITFVVVPDSTWVTLTTAGERVLISRATMFEIAGTVAQAAGIGSIVPCGAEPCPPAPVIVTWNSSALASSGPCREATTPVGAPGSSRWRRIGSNRAMARLRQVSRDEADERHVLPMYQFLFGDRDPVAEPGTSTGTPGDWWTVFALDPEIFAHCVAGFRIYRSPRRRLDPLLRELGQTRAGWLTGSQFVYSQHCKSCRGLGMDEDKIAAIHAWEVADCFDVRERALLAYTDYLVDQHGRVPDPVFHALHEHFADEEILEFTYITSLYFMHAVMTRALRLEFDDRDDPIVEVEAPDDFDPAAFATD